MKHAGFQVISRMKESNVQQELSEVKGSLRALSLRLHSMGVELHKHGILPEKLYSEDSAPGSLRKRLTTALAGLILGLAAVYGLVRFVHWAWYQ